MSAEVENSKDEEVKVQAVKKPLRKKILGYWPVGIKVLQLLVCAVCMGLIYEPLTRTIFTRILMHHIGVMYTSYTGYMVINCVLLVSKALGDKIPYRTVALFAIIGSALFLITGMLLIVDTNDFIRDATRPERDYSDYDESSLKTLFKISAGFAFLNALLFAADAAVTFKLQDDF
ncbi:uncharacterized protein LOC108918002 isoform X1 [Anoplophora glabripennis]|uniref:uncharacterized protein LOC108918002 isoform X1 n=1 Tax=Anoplophora glabripennis TaxID=217634 RepID=UPI000873AB00|nr:uncharacterized protein LOC108918002 isoform X1 [Anoplophora glabripennis]